jgi:hypothetical protein
MSACSQCGTVVKPADKFCNVCGSPIVRASAPPAAGAGYVPPAAQPTFASERERAAPAPYAPTPAAAYPPAPAPAYAPLAGGGAAFARCQAGHEIAPGGSYCAQGHPIALDQMQFANDPYVGGYGLGPPPQGYAPPPRAPGGHPTAPPSPYGAALAQSAYSPAPNQAAYAAAFGAPAMQPGFSPQQELPPFPVQPVYAAPAPQAGPQPTAFGDVPSRDAGPTRALRGFLVAYGTNPNGDFWPLTAGRHTIGRFGTGEGLDVPLQDPTISSRHAAMVVDAANGSVGVEDTGSTNGTFVNDEHIGYGGRRELRDGDRVRFGGFTTIVKVIGRV